MHVRFFWKLFFIKTIFKKKYLEAGNGKAISKGRGKLVEMLLIPSQSVVSCDGYKSSIIGSVFNKFLSSSKNNFVIIGHPKAMSAYSFKRLECFLSKTTKQGHRFPGIRDVFGSNGSSHK